MASFLSEADSRFVEHGIIASGVSTRDNTSKMGRDSERGKYTSPSGSRTWEYLTAVICALGTACLGIALGWNSPSLAEFNEPNSRVKFTPSEASTLMSCLHIGQVISLPLSFFIVDYIGRKRSILFATLPMMVSWVMILVAESVQILIVARILAGIFMGLKLCIGPIYTSEVMSPDIRGSMGSIGLITFFVGILFMFGVAPYLGVRVTACVCLGFTVIYTICVCLIPESPYFLAMVGRLEEAENALEKIRGKTDVAEELELIKATLREKGKSLLNTENQSNTAKQSAFKQLFTIRGNLKALFIGLVLTTLNHMCGLSGILSYCHIIFAAIGSDLDVYLASLIFSGLQILSGLLHVLVVDKYGRRPLLFVSGGVSGSLLLIIASYFYLMDYHGMDLKEYTVVPLGSIFLLVMAINLGAAPLPGLVTSELLATDVKVLASCIVGVFGAVVGVYSTKSYLVLASSLGLGHSVPFFSYAFVTIFSTVILARFLPETKGKTLLAIQRELNA